MVARGRYAVGVEYAHAEARKSPVVDGKVMRNARGRETRYPVILTAAEKEIARKVVVVFGQTLCGFDILRSNGKSYVCDVNGWSFVKDSHKVRHDAYARITMPTHASQCLHTHHNAYTRITMPSYTPSPPLHARLLSLLARG